MRRHQQRKAARASGYGLAREINIPLPIKGVLAEASTAEVSAMFAGELTNWKSTGASLELRSQYGLDASGLFALQRIPYEFGDSEEYIRVLGSDIRTASASLSKAYAQDYTHGLISGYAIMADGSGDPVLYDGTTLSNAAFTTSTSVTQDQFDGVLAHQDRPFFWKTGDGLDFYYGDVGAVSGALDRYPLGRLGNIRGKIRSMKSLTVDAGHGMNDVLAIFTTTGDIIVYEGLDPGNTLDWRQLARLRVAPPIDKDAFIEVGSDVWMLTKSGIVSVARTLRDSELALVSTISRPIRKRLIARIEEGGTWSMHMAADATTVIINRVHGGAASQFMYRTDTKTWDETDYPAKAWHNLGQKTQFTTLDGMLATLGQDGGFEITATWKSGWFRLPRSSGITYLKPTIIANGALSVTVTLLSDHDETSGDVSEARQTVTIEPDDPADTGGRVSIDEEIAVDAVGEVFQLELSVTAEWAEIVNMKAGVF